MSRVPERSRHAPTVSPRVRVLVGGTLALLAILYLARSVDGYTVWRTMARAEGWALGGAAGAVALTVLVKAQRWKVLLDDGGPPVALREALAVLVVGQALNTLLPLRAGDLSRAYLIGQSGRSRSFALGTIVVEKGLDSLAYALLFFCSCSCGPCRTG